MAITAFLSSFTELLNRGPGSPASLRHVPPSSIFSPTDWTSCALSYIIIWCPLFFLRASQFHTQFIPSTVKVISWYSSTGCTCYLHRCISYFDSLAGSEVNMQQCEMKSKKPHPGFELKSLIPFPTTIAVMLSMPPRLLQIYPPWDVTHLSRCSFQFSKQSNFSLVNMCSLSLSLSL